MLRLILGVTIFVVTLLVIMIRPYRIPEAAAACVGALLMLLGGFVSPGAALSALVRRQRDAVVPRRLRGGRRHHGVPLERRHRVDPDAGGLHAGDAAAALPFMFACTFIADTASFLLPVSNPINVLVLDSFGGDLATFLRYLLLPSLFCIVFNVALFAWLFRRQLRLRFEVKPPASHEAHGGYFRYTLVVLVLIALGYLVASALGAPLSFVALAGAAALLIGALIFPRFEFSAQIFLLLPLPNGLALQFANGTGYLEGDGQIYDGRVFWVGSSKTEIDYFDLPAQ